MPHDSDSRRSWPTTLYGICVSAILIIAALSKLASITTSGIPGTSIDPLLGLKNSHIHVLVITFELLFAGIGLGRRFPLGWISMAVVAFGTFTAYHVLMLISGIDYSCMCFGDNFAALFFSNGLLKYVMPLLTGAITAWGIFLVKNSRPTVSSINVKRRSQAVGLVQACLFVSLILSQTKGVKAESPKLVNIDAITSMTGSVQRIVFQKRSPLTNHYQIEIHKGENPARIFLRSTGRSVVDLSKEEIQWDGIDTLIVQETHQRSDVETSKAEVAYRGFIFNESFPKYSKTASQLAWLSMLTAYGMENVASNPVVRSHQSMYRETNLIFTWSPDKQFLIISNTGSLNINGRSIEKIAGLPTVSKIGELIVRKTISPDLRISVENIFNLYGLEIDPDTNLPTNKNIGRYYINLSSQASLNAGFGLSGFFSPPNINQLVDVTDYRFSEDISTKPEFAGSGISYTLQFGDFPARSLNKIEKLKSRTKEDLKRFGKNRNMMLAALVTISLALYFVMKQFSTTSVNQKQASGD